MRLAAFALLVSSCAVSAQTAGRPVVRAYLGITAMGLTDDPSDPTYRESLRPGLSLAASIQPPRAPFELEAGLYQNRKQVSFLDPNPGNTIGSPGDTLQQYTSAATLGYVALSTRFGLPTGPVRSFLRAGPRLSFGVDTRNRAPQRDPNVGILVEAGAELPELFGRPASASVRYQRDLTAPYSFGEFRNQTFEARLGLSLGKP